MADKSLEQQLRELLDAQGADQTGVTGTAGSGETGDPALSDGQPITIRLASGETVTGASYEEIARTLAKQTKPAPEPEPVATGEPAKYEHKQFAEKFVTDGVEGLDYLAKTKYGFSFSDLFKALPHLARGLQNLSDKEQVREAHDFMKEHKDFKPSEDNWAAVKEIADQTGLNLQTSTGLAVAWNHAKASGRVKGAEPVEPAPKRGMPRSGSPASAGDSSGFIHGIDDLDDNRLEALFRGNQDKVRQALLGS